MREFKADLPHSLCECEWEWEASVDPQSPGRKRQTRYKSRLQVAEYNMQYQTRAVTIFDWEGLMSFRVLSVELEDVSTAGTDG